MITKNRVVAVLALWISFVFIQSLFFKFTDAPETQHIFGVLDSWAAGFGFAGVFDRGGIFSAYVIGSAELIASSTLLLTTFIVALRKFRILGGLLAAAIMTGAIFFHLFTPLGVDVQGDGGALFIMAITVWLSGIAVVILDYKSLRENNPDMTLVDA